MKILVVDDRPENRTILRAKLGAAGHAVIEAGNGMDALKALRAEPADLIVTDLMMPSMDGYQLTHAIKTDDALKKVPVIVYTSTYTEEQDKNLALNLGANAYLERPATDEEFFATMNEVLNQASRGELPQRAPTAEEVGYLRQYSERLVHKLEDKVQELETAQRDLQRLNASLKERVEAATSELRQSNQELEAFVYSVSHDLRSPLRGIHGFLSVISTNDPPLSEEERAEFLERSMKLALQAQTLINDLLEYSRLKAATLNLQPVKLSAIVEGAVERIDPASRDKASIEVRPLASVVLGHEATLVQAVYNLVSNALKFTAPGLGAEVAIFETREAGRCRLFVKDRGIGIQPEYQQRIFKAFERLHDSRSYPGSGIGLAIVLRAVEKMGGRIGVESSPGQGSTFWIELPCA